MGLLDFFKTKNALPQDVKKDTKNPERYLEEQQKYRQFEDLKTLEDAITEAQNITNPQRYGLNRIYDEIEKDPHFISQWESRKMKTIQRGFGLYSGDSEDKDPTTELLETDWFHKTLHYILDSKKRGFELIIFGDWDGNKFKWSKDANGFLYQPVRNINYDHVFPEKGLIKRSNYDFDGLDMFKPPISNKTLFVGDPKSFGILEKCAKYILIKNNCLLNWSEFAEVFGHDLRIGKTQAQGKDRQAFFEMLKKLGSGGFGVMDEDDVIEFAGTSRTDAYQVYKELNEYVDKNISKIIFGQDVISDMTGVTRGTAAENVADLYGDHDAKFIKGIINNELIPKLISMGLPLEGKIFEWDSQEGMTLTEQSEIDLKISQMGKVIDEEYLTDKYGTVFKEQEDEGEMSGELPQIFEYHIENGIVNKNEVRARLGFPPDNSVDKEDEDAELMRKLGVMNEARTAGIALEEAARLAGFEPSEIAKIVKASEQAQEKANKKIASPEQVANQLKKLYGKRDS